MSRILPVLYLQMSVENKEKPARLSQQRQHRLCYAADAGKIE